MNTFPPCPTSRKSPKWVIFGPKHSNATAQQSIFPAIPNGSQTPFPTDLRPHSQCSAQAKSPLRCGAADSQAQNHESRRQQHSKCPTRGSCTPSHVNPWSKGGNSDGIPNKSGEIQGVWPLFPFCWCTRMPKGLHHRIPGAKGNSRESSSSKTQLTGIPNQQGSWSKRRLGAAYGIPEDHPYGSASFLSNEP